VRRRNNQCSASGWQPSTLGSRLAGRADSSYPLRCLDDPVRREAPRGRPVSFCGSLRFTVSRGHARPQVCVRRLCRSCCWILS
jgi:hypothetical protein